MTDLTGTTQNVLLRAQDVAKVLNISVALAYKLIQTGELTSVKIGTAVRVRHVDLDAFIEKNLKLASY